jgi:flagellar basal body P-ring protein FlgI
MGKEPLSDLEKKGKSVQEIMESKDRPKIVGDAAEVLWTDVREYEGYGVVNGLADTGGDVKPSPQRDYILAEMRADGVDNPNHILKQTTTALASLAIIVSPEHTKGQKMDVIVTMSDQSEGSSLRNGWLMPSQLREMVFLDKLRESDLKAKAQGAVVIPPSSYTGVSVESKAGIILGGANLIESRRFAIRIKDNLRHVSTAAEMSRAINDRYWFYDGSDRRGVASAKNDTMIFFDTPPRFRWDMAHYADVVMSVGFSESPLQRKERMEKCRVRLQEPTAALLACAQLESIGEEAIPALESGLSHESEEVRFHSAYALAHLNAPSAIPVLAALTKSSEKYRGLCLIGLQIHEHFSAKDTLVELLQDEIPSVRNGALWALRRRDARDTLTQGFEVGELTHFVAIPSRHPMIAVSLEERPEIAVFGSDTAISMKGFFEINPRMTIRSREDGRLQLVRFQPRDEDLSAVSEPELTSLIEAFHSVGATYNDLVVWLDEASRQGWLKAPIHLNPRPRNPTAAIHVLTKKLKAADGSLSKSEKPTSEIAAETTEDSKSENRWWPF